MEHKTFSKSDQKISTLGHGTWGMGGMWGARDDRGAIDVLLSGFEKGIHFVDTALAYGKGHSESLVASALKSFQRSDSVFVATKIPPFNHRWPGLSETSANQSFPVQHVLNCTETSLRNLRQDHIDLQQFHVWHDDWLQFDEILESIERLKESGKIRFFGVSINDHAPETALKIVESGLVDSVQVIYNVFDQSPQEKLFPLCLKHKVSVIARVPFDEGSLTGQLNRETEFHKKDWRRVYFTPDRWDELESHLQQLIDLAESHQMTLPELALRFCLSHPAVTTVIPGMRKQTHLNANLQAAQKGALTQELLTQLARHKWLRNFYPFQP